MRSYRMSSTGSMQRARQVNIHSYYSHFKYGVYNLSGEF